MRLMFSAVLLFGGMSACGLLASTAQAKTCQVSLDSNDRMKFDRNEIVIDATCTAVTLTLTHTGKQPVTAMGHNWVLTRTADFRAVAMAGGRAKLADGYLPKNDARVIAHTAMIGGGESTRVTFSTAKLQKGADYTFFCSFPGHWSLMKGKLVFGGKTP